MRWTLSSSSDNVPSTGRMIAVGNTLRTGQADVVVGFYTRQKGVLLKHKDGGGYKNALLQPMRTAFAVREDFEGAKRGP